MKSNRFFWFLFLLTKVRSSFQSLINNESQLLILENIKNNFSSFMGNNSTTTTTTKTTVKGLSISQYNIKSRGQAQEYPKQLYIGKSRTNYRSENTSYKMDRTIIGAIIIGCIFLFITLSITVTIIIFCLKKNTVFVFQKSEQEDIHDCTYEDCFDSISYQSSLHCDDHRPTSCNTVPTIRRNMRNQKAMCEYFNKCPVELFYPMHYDKPYPIQFNHILKPSHKRCQCPLVNNRISISNHNTSKGELSDSECEQLPWHKIHEGSIYKPLFKEILKTGNKSLQNPISIKVKLDLISHSRQVTAANISPNLDKSISNDKPLIKEFIENSISPNDTMNSSTKIVLTPLGKSQTFTELNPLQKINSLNKDYCQLSGSSKRIPESRSNCDFKMISKRNF